jgi:hypothetical protein
MGTVFQHRSPSPFLSPGPSGNQAPSFKGRALHHVAEPFPSRVYDGRPITARARSHHDGGSLTPEAAATKLPRYTIGGLGSRLRYVSAIELKELPDEYVNGSDVTGTLRRRDTAFPHQGISYFATSRTNGGSPFSLPIEK